MFIKYKFVCTINEFKVKGFAHISGNELYKTTAERMQRKHTYMYLFFNWDNILKFSCFNHV